MAITGSTDLGRGRHALTISHDPTVTPTLAPAGSILIDSSGKLYIKNDDGSTTNVTAMIDKINTVTTTDATPTTIATITLDDNTVYMLTADVQARRTDAADRAIYIRRACVFRRSGGFATIEGTVDTPLTRESRPQYNATFTLSGNDVLIQVQGMAGHTVNWRSKYHFEKVT